MTLPKTIRLTALHIWLLSLINLGLIVMVLWMIGGSGSSKVPDTENEVYAPPLSETDIDALNPYGQALLRAGLPQCAMAMNGLSARLLKGNQVGIYRFPIENKQMANMSMEVVVEGGATIYMTFNFFEQENGGCQISYEAVSSWSNGCKEVAETIFSAFQPTRNLAKTIGLHTHAENSNRKIMTMPVNKGCIIIEKEIIDYSP